MFETRMGQTALPGIPGDIDERECDRLAVALHTTRFWRPGDVVQPGDLVGATVDANRPVRANALGRVVSIEYDVERDELILLVQPIYRLA
jgi:hypothetical protein